MKIFIWLFAMLLGFGAGYNAGKDDRTAELEQKVQEHMDVIVDESAMIVDDISDYEKEMREIRESEYKESDCYKKTEEFKNDVKQIVDNTKADIEDHFGETETEF